MSRAYARRQQSRWRGTARGLAASGSVGRRAWILLWTLALIWGASYLFIKLGLEDLEPVFLVLLRLVLGAARAARAGRAARRAARRCAAALRPLVVLAAMQVADPVRPAHLRRGAHRRRR